MAEIPVGQPGGTQGPAIDKHGNEVVDPTKNVLDLVAAAIARQDDLRQAEKEHLLRSVIAQREYIDGQIQVLTERLAAIDKASSLLAETVDRVPEAAISKLRELMDERFASIGTQFKERDTRQERESRDNKVAVDAAFAAQKEASAKQEETFAKSIDKSELATAETISKLQDLTATQARGLTDRIDSSNAALTDKIDDLKARLTQIEAISRGRVEERTDTRATHFDTRANASLVVAIIASVILLLGFLGYQATRTAEPIVVERTVTTP